MNIENAEMTIHSSMQNMVDLPTLYAFFAPLGYFSDVSQKSGYDGMEYFPWRLPDAQLRTGLASQGALDTITSAHQGFRSERSIKEVLKHPNPKLAAFFFVTTTERVSSLESLQKLQQIKGRNLPLVVYPHHEWQGENEYDLFKELAGKLVQPAPELLGRWGLNSVSQFAKAVTARGYSGLCLDLFHIRRFPTQGFNTGFAPWQEAIPQLLPDTKEIHLGVGRFDFKGNFDSMAELMDLYTGNSDTDIVPILEMVRDSGWRGPIVTEIPARAIAKIINKRLVTPRLYIEAHSRITQNLRQVLG